MKMFWTTTARSFQYYFVCQNHYRVQIYCDVSLEHSNSTKVYNSISKRGSWVSSNSFQHVVTHTIYILFRTKNWFGVVRKFICWFEPDIAIFRHIIWCQNQKILQKSCTYLHFEMKRNPFPWYVYISTSNAIVQTKIPRWVDILQKWNLNMF